MKINEQTKTEIVEAYRAIQDRKMDEEAFSFMNADEQAYQILGERLK
jgi:hypothetical protein